ncbi:dihydrolipoyl dehydrogenase [Maritimibacter sp. UBA3975]|uniref:dihydrolipoyl dehydrogenase n=1 Tax=Maritimibacter sp. UBA3975 TaxID=1946833 RepID=UPI000C0A378C|nr:dihydrolipoyl dehydrogenase [Maritimibacter sp. UBA3975]MAM59935.1 dihydrolipoyl dehydrogenase [Maritimibacter sp.]|tara:strand:- start:32955 stop:34331 length:1377 start_codon:yes stop_codon:yes gene_type:complete
MADMTCDFLVIGGGPGGYVAAIRAGQLGLKTVLIEKDVVGGTCLNFGCIPSKALIHAAEKFDAAVSFAGDNALGIQSTAPSIDYAKTVGWKDGVVDTLTGGVRGLLKRAKVEVVNGIAQFIDGKAVQVDTGARITAKTIVIATGSTPVDLPSLPFGGDVLSSTEALALTHVPPSLAVVGGGYIGLEIGTAFAKLGARVTVVEAGPSLLPQYDAELVGPVGKRLRALGVTIHLSARATGHENGRLRIKTPDGMAQIDADKVLVAVGRKPYTGGLGLDRLALPTDGGFITANDRCETPMRGVFAIGDVSPGPMLAHRAMAEGEMVAEIAAGHARVWDKQAMPATCFTDPEIVTVGLSPQDAKARFGETKIGRFPFIANGRALATEGTEGMVRVVARGQDNRIVGIQAVGQGISELSSAFSIALDMGARLEDLAAIVQSHPTRSEGFAEAALQALGRAIHI